MTGSSSVFNTHKIIPGALSSKFPGQCEIIQFNIGLQPVYTIALVDPRMDMTRLWPLPVQQPWFEGGRDKPKIPLQIG